MENTGTFENYELDTKKLEEMQNQFKEEIKLLEDEIKLLNKNKSEHENEIKVIKEQSKEKLDENNLLIKKNEDLIKENNKLIEENKIIIEKKNSILSEEKQKEEEKKINLKKIKEEICEKQEMITEHKNLIKENIEHIKELKNPKKAEKKSKEIEKDENKALSIKKQAAIFFRQKQYIQAINKFEESLLYVPEEKINLITILNSNIGICLMRLKKYKEAINSLNSALAQNPNFVKAQVNRAECNYQIKNYDACISEYDDLMKKNRKFVNLAKYNEVKRLQKEEFEKKKDEVMGQMKDLGDKFLGMFGMSTDNFNLNQNANGGYNIGFQK